VQVGQARVATTFFRGVDLAPHAKSLPLEHAGGEGVLPRFPIVYETLQGFSIPNRIFTTSAALNEEAAQLDPPVSDLVMPSHTTDLGIQPVHGGAVATKQKHDEFARRVVPLHGCKHASPLHSLIHHVHAKKSTRINKGNNMQALHTIHK
jgi:hypothetical protein